MAVIPGRLGVDPAGVPVHRGLQPAQAGQGQGAQPRDGARVAAHLAVDVDLVLPLGVLGKGLRPNLSGELQCPRLGRADPGAPELEQGAIALPPLDPAADAVAGFKHHDVHPGGGQRPGRGEPGKAGSYHRNVGAHLL